MTKKDKLTELKLKGHSCNNCFFKICKEKCSNTNWSFKDLNSRVSRNMPKEMVCDSWMHKDLRYGMEK